MTAATNLNIRIERSLKDEAENLFTELGLSLTSAINVFLRQAVRQQKIPFEIALAPADSLVTAKAALNRIWRESMNNGTANMTADEINAEIALSRADHSPVL